jgi:hypothetical protein
VDLPVADRDDPATGVDHQLTDPEGSVAAVVSAAEDRRDARFQIGVGERLGDVVVGAEVTTAGETAPVLPVQEHDDRQVRVDPRLDPVGLADLLQHVDARHVGQGQVEDEDVGVVEATEPKGVGAARRRQCLEVVGDQVLAEHLEGGVVPVADDDRRDLVYLGHDSPPSDPWYLPSAMWSSFGFRAPVVGRTREDVRSSVLAPSGPPARKAPGCVRGPAGDVPTRRP